MTNIPTETLNYSPLKPTRSWPDWCICLSLVGVTALLHGIILMGWLPPIPDSLGSSDMIPNLIEAFPWLLVLGSMLLFSRRRMAFLTIVLILIEVLAYQALIAVVVFQALGGSADWRDVLKFIQADSIYILLGTLTALLLATLRKYPGVS